jgi:hypothetical protein
MYLITKATALSRLAASSDTKEESDILFDLAARRYQESLNVKPNDYRSLHNHAYSLYLQAMNRVRFSHSFISHFDSSLSLSRSNTLSLPPSLSLSLLKTRFHSSN